MFNKIKNHQKKVTEKQEEADRARAAECRKAVEAVLESYSVDLQPYLIFHPTGVYPDVQFIPRQKPQNEPGDIASAAAIAGQAKADEQATRTGAPIDSTKVE